MNAPIHSELILAGNAYDNFVNTIKSQVTLENYNNAIKRFMLYLSITDVNNLLIIGKDPLEIQQKIINYILYLKKDKGLSAISINSYVAGIIHFYAMNDVTLNRKKIGRYIPESVRKHKDRAYTIQEISQLLEFCDLRSRAIVLLFASTGVRIGALPNLRLENLTKISKYDLYQFTVYAGYKEEYICYCTPECAKAIDAYLQYRERCGEILTEKSPLFREQFDVTDLEQVRKKAKKVIINTVAKSISKKLDMAGIMPIGQLKEGELASRKRKSVMRTHGFRKFVNTTFINAKLNDTRRNMLLGHSTELDESYYRPKPDDLLEEYLKAVDMLTINEEHRLRRQVAQLIIDKDEIHKFKKELDDLKDMLNLK